MGNELLEMEDPGLLSEISRFGSGPTVNTPGEMVNSVLFCDKTSINRIAPSSFSDRPGQGEILNPEHKPGEVIVKENSSRKLVAILIADVVGYCRLMYEDEIETVSQLSFYKGIMIGLIENSRGRVVNSPGDSLMAEFSSVIDATRCAVAVQNRFAELNEDLPEGRKMEFRIGINIGDVIDLGNQIYGGAVNIAARLQSMADPGGICISRTVHDQIECKLHLDYDYLGVRKAKNIPELVPAYRVRLKRKNALPIKINKKKRDKLRKRTNIYRISATRLLANVGSFFTGLLKCSLTNV